ncbi:juvenile hormone esterase-like [Anticarsia gemmatalis]|uniref:juvenile hormone esterase-like n=1 Tax=Anticarsia gemmatalis TaxID=129554 RepID=UPI003F76BCF1
MACQCERRARTMWSRLKWLVLWSLWAARGVRHPSPPLRLRQGALRGQLAPDATHYQYFGISYATSHHHYRFKAPGPAPAWEGVFEAVDENVRCPQLYAGGVVVGREDCLVLNVYAPLHASAAAPLPVMVFIHGGGFKEGSGARLLYGPDYLVARGVVLVTFNYRLGVHGFLCLGIKDAPGNAGMKDQVAALKWVQRNIRAFGGDPDNVTIFGESAGGASVSYHLLSSASRGLFHRAIIQSGSSLAPWALQTEPLQTATVLAKALGHTATEPHQLYHIFMNETLSNMITAKMPKKEGRFKYLHLPFTPCYEPQIDGEEPFFTHDPYDIYTSGKYNKVPVIIGANDQEGYFFAALEDDESLTRMSFEASLPSNLQFPSATERRAAAERVRREYLGDGRVSRDTSVQLSRLHGEPYFNFPALVETELLLSTSDQPVYSYVFEHDGWRNFPKFSLGLRWWRASGATHADELFYLFNLFPVPTVFETDMINIMTAFWSNFAKYGSPGEAGGVRWRAADTLRLSARPHHAPPPQLPLWRDLYRAYGHQPTALTAPG